MPNFEKKSQEIEPVYYFAYGLDRDPCQFARLGIEYEEAGPAVLMGHRLVFNALEDEHFRFEKRGIANILPSSYDTVEGMVYRIREEDLKRLDSSQGVWDLKYYRKQVSVKRESGHFLLALTYAAWPDMTSEGLLPSEAYLKQFLAAGQSAISDRFRQWLQHHPTTL